MRTATVDQVSEERPIHEAAARWTAAALELHFLTTPDIGGSIVGGDGRGGSDHGNETVPRALDPARSRWRRAERTAIRKLTEQAIYLERLVRGELIDPGPGWRCTNGHWAGRNPFCAACGQERPKDEAPRNGGGTTRREAT